MSSAARSQSTQKSLARGSRNANRAWFAGCGPPSSSGAYRARPSALAARMSSRSLRDHGRRAGHGVEHRPDARPHPGLRGAPSVSRAPGRRRTGQVEQVHALGLVQAQRVGQGLQDALRHPAEVSPLEAGVVVDADAGQHRAADCLAEDDRYGAAIVGTVVGPRAHEVTLRPEPRDG